MNYSILINADNLISEENLKEFNLIKIYDLYGNKTKIETETYKQFLILKKYLKKYNNIEIGIDMNNYRTYEDQVRIFDEISKQYGKDYAKKYVAKPRASEHHTGLAIDLNIKVNGKWCENNDERFNQSDTFSEIHKQLDNYGFILRYPIKKEKITGYFYEPWHIRYVGKKIAKYLYSNNLTLEEYFKI